ncbi:MAG: PEP-CTERM sorting domain-containing protein [Planctomycetota bacterium]
MTSWDGLTQGDPAKQPAYVASGLGGQPSVNFDGATYPNGDVLYQAGANVAPRTIFAVVNAESGGGLRGLLSRGDDRLNIRLHDSSFYRSPGHSQDGNDFTGAGGTGEFYINGALGAPYSVNSPHVATAVSAADHTYTNLLVGGGRDSGGPWAGRFWDGDIAEIIVYEGELGGLQRNQVILFEAGVDYPVTDFYRYIRYDVTASGINNHALAEIEYFGYTPEPTSLALLGAGPLALLRRRRRA